MCACVCVCMSVCVCVSVNLLKKLGTHAGNDAIVAFAKLHDVNVMIHQLNGKPLMVLLSSSHCLSVCSSVCLCQYVCLSVCVSVSHSFVHWTL